MTDEIKEAMPEEKRKCTISLYYPESVISVNHYLGRNKDGGEYVVPKARQFMEDVGWLLKTQHLEEWKPPLSVTCSGVFKDGRSAPDLSNLSKCILDAIEDLTGINDSNFRWHDGSRIIDSKRQPEIFITVEEGE